MNAPAITATPTIMQNAIERYSFALFIAINEIGWFDNIANVQKKQHWWRCCRKLYLLFRLFFVLAVGFCKAGVIAALGVGRAVVT